VNQRGPGWRWGARPAIVAVVGVVVGYFTNIVSAGNQSVAAVAGFVCTVVAFFGLVWWDSVRQAGTAAGPSVVLDQQVGTVRDGSVTAVEVDGAVSGDHDLHQRVGRAERSDVRGIRHLPPSSSQGGP